MQQIEKEVQHNHNLNSKVVDLNEIIEDAKPFRILTTLDINKGTNL